MNMRFHFLCVAFLALIFAGCGKTPESVPPPEVAPPPSPATSTPQDTPAAATTPVSAPGQSVVESPASAAPASEMRNSAASASEQSTDSSKVVADPKLLEKVKAAAAAPKTDVNATEFNRIAVAMHQYIDQNSHLPAIDGNGQEGSANGLSWRVMILPALGEEELFSQFKLDEAWDSEHNKSLLAKMPAVYGNDPSGLTMVQLFTGAGVPFQAGKGVSLNEITDGMSITIMLIRTGADKATEWTRPTALAFDARNPQGALGNVGPHALIAMFDGSVKFIDANSTELARMIQHQDGQMVSDNELKVVPGATGISGDSPAIDLSPLPAMAELTEGMDTLYVPADTTAFFSISPRRLFESELVQGIISGFKQGDETSEQTVQRLSGADMESIRTLTAIEEIRASFDKVQANGVSTSTVTNELPPGATGVYLRSSIPMKLESLFQHFAASAEKIDVEDVNGIVHAWLRGTSVVMAFPSDREVIISNNNAISSVVNAKADPEAKSPIANALKSQKPRMISYLIVPQEGAESIPAIGELLEQAGPAALMVPQLKDANLVQFSLDLDASEFARLTFGFANADHVLSTATVAEGLIFQGQKQGEMFQAMLDQTKPDEKVQHALIGDLMQGTSVAKENDRVSIVIQHPPHLDQVASVLQGLLGQFSGMSLPAESELPPLERIGAALLAYNEDYGHLPAPNGPGSEDGKPVEIKKETPLPGSPGSEFATPNLNPDATANEPPMETNPKGRGAVRNRLQPGQTGLPRPGITVKNRGLSWRVYLLPALGEESLYEDFKLDERWDSTHNKALISRMPAVFGDDPEGKTRVHLVVGMDTLFKSNVVSDANSVRDAPESTILLLETGLEKADFWTKPGGLPFDSRNPTRCLGKPDPDQTEFQAIMLDGSRSPIPVDIEAAEFSSLVKPSDGKPARR